MSGNDIQQIVAYQGELMLLGWSESHNGGRKVTFLVPDDCEEHPLKQFTVKNGKIAGQRFMAALLQVDDNEQPVEQEPKPAAKPEPEMKGGELAKWAGILCADQYFWAWLVDTYSYFYMMQGEGSMEEKAKRFIYEKCGIQSRRELDHNKQAALTFREEIMKPFHQWRESQHA